MKEQCAAAFIAVSGKAVSAAFSAMAELPKRDDLETVPGLPACLMGIPGQKWHNESDSFCVDSLCVVQILRLCTTQPRIAGVRFEQVNAYKSWFHEMDSFGTSAPRLLRSANLTAK